MGQLAQVVSGPAAAFSAKGTQPLGRAEPPTDRLHLRPASLRGLNSMSEPRYITLNHILLSVVAPNKSFHYKKGETEAQEWKSLCQGRRTTQRHNQASHPNTASESRIHVKHLCEAASHWSILWKGLPHGRGLPTSSISLAQSSAPPLHSCPRVLNREQGEGSIALKHLPGAFSWRETGVRPAS